MYGGAFSWSIKPTLVEAGPTLNKGELHITGEVRFQTGLLAVRRLGIEYQTIGYLTNDDDDSFCYLTNDDDSFCLV